MLNLHEGAKQQLIKAYKAFYDKAIKEEDLTLDEKKAIGLKVFNELFIKAFNNSDVPESELPILKEELVKLIKQECPDTFFDTPLIYTGKGFQNKN